MTYSPVTPFGRAVDAAYIAQLQRGDTPMPAPRATVNKWEMLREITVARHGLGLSDRDVSVLQALLSFHPTAELDGAPGEMIVYPSNATICARLNGMAESTMRRHLAQLINKGLVTRRDSPNGKRYVRRNRVSQMAFGFDLYPLRQRQNEIRELAEASRIAEDELATLRQTISLMRRDLLALITWGMTEHPALPDWTRLEDLTHLTTRALRRRPVLTELQHLQSVVRTAIADIKALLYLGKSEELSSIARQNEQHYHNSNKEYLDSESCHEAEHQPALPPSDTGHVAKDNDASADPENVLPLHLVLSACAEVQNYAPEPISNWYDLVSTCEVLRPMMGIPPDAWLQAKRSLGPKNAAVVLSGMLERMPSIRSPGGYLRKLVQKADIGTFSTGPMLRALMNRVA